MAKSIHKLWILLLSLVLAVVAFFVYDFVRQIAALEQENLRLRRKIADVASRSQSSVEKAKRPFSKENFVLLKAKNEFLRKRIRLLLEQQQERETKDDSQSKTLLRLATGEPLGYYYQLGKTLQSGTKGSSLEFEILESPGATQNIIFVKADKAELGFTQLDSVISFNASPATRNLARSVAFIAPVIQEKLHIIVRKDAHITSKESNVLHLRDLIGRKVHLGPVGSGSRVSCTNLLQSAGIDLRHLHIDGSFFSTAIDKLIYGELDAMCCIMAIPSPLFEFLPPEVEQQLQLCSLDPRLIEKTAANSSWFHTAAKIEDGTYKWQKGEVDTIATECLLIAGRRADRKMVIRILQTIFRYQGCNMANRILPAIFRYQRELDDRKWQFLTIDTLRRSFEKHRRFYHPGVKKFLDEVQSR